MSHHSCEKKSAPAHKHGHSLRDEFLCHFPYAILSVALSLVVMGLLTYIVPEPDAAKSHSLFHTFHFMHLLFAGMGVAISFRRYSHSVIGFILSGTIIPMVFCTLSDAIIPYWGAALMGLHVHFHWCFVSHISTVLPFLLVGLVNGYILSLDKATRHTYHSTSSHFFHIFLSSLAASFYLMSFGMTSEWTQLGGLFVLLLVAVVVPCTLSDLVVPFLAAKLFGHTVADKKENNNSSCC